MPWTSPKPIKPAYTRSIPEDTPGVYRLHNEYGTTIYVGRSTDLEHRLSHYHQKDDLKRHPTKKALRKEATHFSFRKITDKEKRRATEKRLKQGKKHNWL